MNTIQHNNSINHTNTNNNPSSASPFQSDLHTYPSTSSTAIKKKDNDDIHDLQSILQLLHSHIDLYPDWPQPHILFRDITPLFHDTHCALHLITCITTMAHNIIQSQSQASSSASSHSHDATTNRIVFIGLEARGFMIAPLLAFEYQRIYNRTTSFIPIRKYGKLPGQCYKSSYKKEYGSDTFELQQHVLHHDDICMIVDDLLATGGTICSAMELIEMHQNATHDNVQILGVVTIVELCELQGRKRIEKQHHNIQVRSLLKYNDDKG
jgi:adenine phosphoribosyltransferase